MGTVQDKIITRLDELRIRVNLSTSWERGVIALEYSSDPNYQKFPSVLGILDYIEQLTIKNSLWQEIPRELIELSNVGRIRLILDNATTVAGLEEMTTLMSLGLYMPKLTELPKQFGKLDNLKFLAIQAPLKDLPESILDIESLKTLYLDKTNLTIDDTIIQQLEQQVSVRFTDFPIP